MALSYKKLTLWSIFFEYNKILRFAQDDRNR